MKPKSARPKRRIGDSIDDAQLRLRQSIDEMLIEAVEAGATIRMDDADWASLRRAARLHAKKRQRKRK